MTEQEARDIAAASVFRSDHLGLALGVLVAALDKRTAELALLRHEHKHDQRALDAAKEALDSAGFTEWMSIASGINKVLAQLAARTATVEALRRTLEDLSRRLKCGNKEHRVLRSPICGDCQALAKIEAALSDPGVQAVAQEIAELRAYAALWWQVCQERDALRARAEQAETEIERMKREDADLRRIETQWSSWFDQLRVPCDKCGGSGFDYDGSYGSVCDCSGGYIGLYEPKEILERAERAETENARLKETYTDGEGTVWTVPTAWAYAQACKALHKHEAENARLKNVAAAAKDISTCGFTDSDPEYKRIRWIDVQVSRKEWAALTSALADLEEVKGE